MAGGGPPAEHGGSRQPEPAMFALLTRLFRPNAAAPAASRPVPTTAPADDDRPRGCGWFDSSHELMRGVTVWEGIIVVDNTLASPP
jgi:hypothetical protein